MVTIASRLPAWTPINAGILGRQWAAMASNVMDTKHSHKAGYAKQDSPSSLSSSMVVLTSFSKRSAAG